MGRTDVASGAGAAGSVGALLQHWRRTRQMTQLDLAHHADVSPRHVSFLETGRAKPSREMVLLLGRALDVPLREQNALLLAAGFAPVHVETPLTELEREPVGRAISAILTQQEPFPAVVMNRRWDLVSSNGAANRFFGFLLGENAHEAPPNVLGLMLDPRWLRPWVRDWEDVAEALVGRVHREVVAGVKHPATVALLEDLLLLPGVPAHLRVPDLATPQVPVIPIRFAKDGKVFSYFSTVTTLGTPQDITLQELRIECFFPVDAATEAHARALSAG